jgi:hypothetical protein
MTTPDFEAPILKEVSLTLLAFSPKIARNNFSSGERTVSLLGVTFPTRISPPFTRAPTYTIPTSSSFDSADSLTLGISAVTSSAPRFVSQA